MSESKEYRIPSGDVLDYIILNDVSEKEYDETKEKEVPVTYKVYVSRKKLKVEKCVDEKDEGVLYIKFVDMNDKSDMIFFVKNGKLKLEKI